MLYSKDTSYTRLDEKTLSDYIIHHKDNTYYLDPEEKDIKNTSIGVPETTHLRFYEENYPSNQISSQYYNFRRQDQSNTATCDSQSFPKTQQQQRQKTEWSYYRILIYFTLIFGIVFMVLAIIFKIQSRLYISQSIQNQCPVSCVTTCYLNIPFYQSSTTDCDMEKKSDCDMYCFIAGMKAAYIYSIFFLIFISSGSLLLVIHLMTICMRYCCFDYFNSK
ncbi:uncharacterized protein BX663DRAFT_502161 [Cokeromyces recurvatus]|uniref:uncharacterized protein n=1 Tax=Cokeromyces recurvatus TaxID=90255 RepID=UPI002220D7F1|nr:uncharacterized protein BX663DRAFT_502161 [Cokeromyces recurvatus]KAI7905225.1 hypothetical protein BX663DRAFT_502161 [Cokeromyces recurvatus]